MARFLMNATAFEYEGEPRGLAIAAREFKRYLGGIRAWHELRAENRELKAHVACLERTLAAKIREAEQRVASELAAAHSKNVELVEANHKLKQRVGMLAIRKGLWGRSK